MVVAVAAPPLDAGFALAVAAAAIAVRGKGRTVADVAVEEAVVIGRLAGTDPERATRPTADVAATEDEAVDVGFVLLAIRENFVGIGGNVDMPARLRLFLISDMSQAERLRRNFIRLCTPKVFVGSGDEARTVLKYKNYYRNQLDATRTYLHFALVSEVYSANLGKAEALQERCMCCL